MQDNNKILVMKFGGTSVGSAEAMENAVNIIRTVHVDWPQLVVVTSALSGVTNQLIDSAVLAARGDLSVFHQAVIDLTYRHQNLIDHFIKNPSRKHQVEWEVKHLIGDFSNLCQSINVLGGSLASRAGCGFLGGRKADGAHTFCCG